MAIAEHDEPDPAGVRWMKRGLVVFVGFALLLGFYMAYWTVMARQLQGGLDDWVAARAAEGIAVGFGKRTVRGFPGRLHLVLEDPTVSGGADGRRPWTWTAGRAEAWALPWKLGRVNYALTGVQRLQVGAGDDGAARTYVIANDGVRGEVRLRSARAGELSVRTSGLAVDRDERPEGAVRRVDIDLSWLAGPVAGGETPVPLRFDIGIDGADLPKAWTTPLGRRVSSLRVSGHVAGPLGGGALTAALARWRDGGGTVEITRLAAAHGPLKIDAEGTAALDSRLQPEAAFSLRAEGYLETVGALVEAGIMRPAEGTAANLVLTVLAKRPAGRPAYVETPLTLQDRVLSAGDIRIARVGPVAWDRLAGIILPGRADRGKMGP